MAAAEPFPMDAARAGDTARLNQWRTSTRTRDVVGERLANPVDANFRFDEWRPLQLAAAEGDLVAVDTLLRVGADPRCVAAPSRLPHASALHVAARYGHAAVVAALVEAGCDVDARDSFGFAPLHYAAAHGHLRTVTELASLGADATATADRSSSSSSSVGTPAALARLAGHTKVVEALERRAGETAANAPDHRRLRDWLASIGCGEYFGKILAAGYDFAYIRDHGLDEDDVTALAIPASKKGHAKKLLNKHNFPADGPASPADDEQGDEDDEGESDEEDEDEDESDVEEEEEEEDDDDEEEEEDSD